MTWTFKSFNSTYSGPDLWKAVLNAINSINQKAMPSLKVGVSDRISGNARGVIFYSTNVATVPDPSSLSSTWAFKAFTVSNDYESMYEEVVTFLNSATSGLNDTQKFWAHASFDNAEDYATHIVLWYRMPN